MPKLDPKKVKDLPIDTAEGNSDIAISCGSAWSEQDLDRGRRDSQGLFIMLSDMSCQMES